MNEYKVNGVIYYMIKADSIDSCEGCAFQWLLKECLAAPDCTDLPEGKHIIFVERK
jgi:hypothetical protein